MKWLFYAPTGSGGHPEYVAKLTGGMLQNGGISIDWYSEQDDPAPRYRDPAVVVLPNAVQMPDRADVGLFRWLVSRINWQKRHDLAFASWMWKRDGNYDVIVIEEVQRFTLGIVVWVALRRSNRGVIVHLHNARRHDHRGGLLDWIDERFTGIGLRLATRVVCHDSLTASNAVDRFRLDRARVITIPHGLGKRERSPKTPADAPRVLFFGVNRPSKGLRVLIAALGQTTHPFRLTVAGVTPAHFLDETKEMLSQLNHVEWLNRPVLDSELDRLFSSADIVALPYTHFEAQSGVLHLAVEYGTPVVASRLGGMGELMDSYRVGVTVQPNDPVKLSAALDSLVDTLPDLLEFERLLNERSWSQVGQRFKDWETSDL